MTEIVKSTCGGKKKQAKNNFGQLIHNFIPNNLHYIQKLLKYKELNRNRSCWLNLTCIHIYLVCDV